MASSSSNAQNAQQRLPFNPWDALDLGIKDPDVIMTPEFKKMVGASYRRAMIHRHPDTMRSDIGFPSRDQIQLAHDFLLNDSNARRSYNEEYARRTYPFHPGLNVTNPNVFNLNVYPNVNEPRKRGYNPTPIHLALDSTLNLTAEYLPKGSRRNPIDADAPGPSSGLAPSPRIIPAIERVRQPHGSLGTSTNPYRIRDDTPQPVSPGRAGNPIEIDDDDILDDPEAIIVMDEPRRCGRRVTHINNDLSAFVGWPTRSMAIPVDLRPVVLAKFTTVGSFIKHVKNRSWKGLGVPRDNELPANITISQITFNQTFQACRDIDHDIARNDKLRDMVEAVLSDEDNAEEGIIWV